MTRQPLQLDFVAGTLPIPLVEELSAQNPWWVGRTAAALPEFKRWPFDTLMTRIQRDPPLAKINVLRGPRQIGKSTLQGQIIDALLTSGVDQRRILRVQFDELKGLRTLVSAGHDPILAILHWFEDKVLGVDYNKAARDGQKAFLFLDEVQNLQDWAIQLKALVDRTDAVVVVTGGSALRIELGRDSLAGRMQTVEIGPFRLPEICAFRELGHLPAFGGRGGNGSLAKAEFWRDLASHGAKHAEAAKRAFKLFSERGGYPLALKPGVTWLEAAGQLNDLVVKRVISHDLRIGERGKRRDEQLLQEVFRIAARNAGQAPSPQKLAAQVNELLGGNVGIQRVRKYLEFLDGSLLVRLIRPLEMRLKKQSGAQKICIADHAIRAAWLDETIPLDPDDLDRMPDVADMAGRIAESCVGAFLVSLLDQPVQHLPDRKGQGEVDYVLSAGDYRVPIEVKYQKRIDPIRDTANIRQFMAKSVNRAPLGVLITRDTTGDDLPPGVVAVSLRTLLLMQ